VLKHKPNQQSIQSRSLDIADPKPCSMLTRCYIGYLLDLQSHFPVPDDSQAFAVKHASWRKHALTLEQELESLKQMREEDQEGMFSPSTTTPPLVCFTDIAQNSLVCGKPHPGTCQKTRLLLPTRRKRRKLAKFPKLGSMTGPQVGTSLQASLFYRFTTWKERAKPSNTDGQSSPSLTAAFTSLRSVIDSVSSQTGDDAGSNPCLIGAITRSLLTISSFLGLRKLSTLSFPHSELNKSRIAMVSPPLVYVLRVAFPALFHQGNSTASGTSISRLIDCLLVPLVRSFTLASRAYIAHHIDAASAKKPSKGRTKVNDKVPQTPSETLIPDARMDILTLLTDALDALDLISPTYNRHTAGIMERIALEAIKELGSLYSERTMVGADGTADNSEVQEEASRGLESLQESHSPRQRTTFSRKERLEALARNDATWYLCHILNSCACRGAAKDRLGSMLSGALLDGAATLVKMCISMDCGGVMRVQRRSTIDEVCRNMILAACEKIIGAPPS
jgi:hypothetical protein